MIDAFFKYMGCKIPIMNWVIGNFPKHRVYVEVFGGTGVTLLNKDRSEVEIYNDFNPNLSNLMHVLRTKKEEFFEELDKLIVSEHWYNEFFEYLTSNPDRSEKMEVENAIRYFYIMSLCWMAKFNGGFKYELNEKRGLVFQEKKRLLEIISKRLQGVQILNKPFDYVVDKFNQEDVLMYLDPPYVGTEYMYKALAGGFTETSHLVLRDMLWNFKGIFMLSYEDDQMLRDIYKGFYFIEKDRESSIRKGKEVNKEIIITNLEPKNQIFKHESVRTADQIARRSKGVSHSNTLFD